jgi:alkanesulfonate monooxygenase SsuD/methylene tetrahydromethanopterin reductase-like flavin-dependent oxidoreductase (luciferase family)
MTASCIAWYLTAMGDVYATSVSSQGYATEVKTIIAANPRPSPRHGIVPADAQVVLDQLAVCGTPDQVRQQLEPWDEATDTASIIVPPGLPWSTIEATIRAAAPGA